MRDLLKGDDKYGGAGSSDDEEEVPKFNSKKIG